jgi:hypothetical protein
MMVSISSDKLQDPLTPWGKAIFNPHEFRELWNRGKPPLLVIVKEKKLAPLGATIGEAPQPVAKIDEYVLVSNR